MGSRRAARTCRGRELTITRLVSDQLVEVDGVSWHVRCVRRRYGTEAAESGESDEESELDDLDVPVVEMSRSDTAPPTTGSDPERPPPEERPDPDPPDPDLASAADGGEECDPPTPQVTELRWSTRVRLPPSELYGRSVPSEWIEDEEDCD